MRMPKPAEVAPAAAVTDEERARQERSASIAAEGAKKSKAVHDAVSALETVIREVVPEGPYRDSGLQLLGKAHRVFVNQIFSTAVQH